jgi:ABC-type multidrug transport system fused ATPase/permease subunit
MQYQAASLWTWDGDGDGLGTVTGLTPTGEPSGDPSLIATLSAFYRALSLRQRRHFRLVVALMALGALPELVTIGAVLPFLALIADPGRAAQLPGYGLFLALVGGLDGVGLVARAAALLIAAVILAAAVRLVIISATQRFVFTLGHEIGTAIFGRMLRQPYRLYIGRNPSIFISGVNQVHALIYAVLLPLMHGFTAALMAAAIMIFLIAIAPGPAALAAGAATLVYFAVTLATAGRLKADANVTAEMAARRMQAVQEGLGGIRDILLDHSQEVFEEEFRRLDRAYREAQARIAFVGLAPRHLVEAAGIVFIGLLALHMSAQPGGFAAAIPVLGALALGAQRLLPLLQTAYVGWSQFSGHGQILRDLLALMEAETVVARRVSEPVAFERDIVLDRVSLQYPNGGHAVHDIDLRIAKGERIGLAGKTGSGKSSLLDLLMGLLDPTQGEIRIDGRPLDDAGRPNWQAQIAHVPQSIYLADASIAANIAFAFANAEIDMARVREAAKRAQLDEFIESSLLGYDMPVGDRGVRLSGGQRQRIAIARAFYKRANILILDEATGQLDQETERAIIDAVAEIGRDITIIIVAHRASALAGCDRILCLEDGRLAG